MVPLMTLAEFRLRTLMPAVDVDAVENDTTGFTLARLVAQSSRLLSRLRKRYSIPVVAPIPEVILEWLVKIVTYELYVKRGFNPADQSIAHIKADKDLADAEIKEAADSVTGLFDLPLADTNDASAITKGGPIVYSETSPHRWTDLQRVIGSEEDRNRGR